MLTLLKVRGVSGFVRVSFSTLSGLHDADNQ